MLTDSRGEPLEVGCAVLVHREVHRDCGRFVRPSSGEVVSLSADRVTVRCLDGKRSEPLEYERLRGGTPMMFGEVERYDDTWYSIYRLYEGEKQ